MQVCPRYHTSPLNTHLLRAEPIPWRPAEFAACQIYATYSELQDKGSGWTQRRRALAEKALGPNLANFFTARRTRRRGSGWESPARTAHAGEGRCAADQHSGTTPPPPNGSNAFAVSGAKTSSGRAIVANDMHLPLRVPNIWYRARLLVQQSEEVALDLNGVTLPGVPLLVAGSNGNSLLGDLTNSHIATAMQFDFNPVPDDSASLPYTERPAFSVDSHRTGCPAGSLCQDLQIESSIWGPVVAHEADGTRIVGVGLLMTRTRSTSGDYLVLKRQVPSAKSSMQLT